MNELKDKGYTCDFNLDDTKITDKKADSTYLPNDFNIDKVYRFEGMTNPSDSSILYAITTSNNRKGLLVDGYGVTGGQVSKELRDKLNR
jgi:hypothetical protein